MMIQYNSVLVIFFVSVTEHHQKQLKGGRVMLTHGIRGIVVHHGRMCGSQSVGLLLAHSTAGRQQSLEEEADQTFNACPSDLALSIRLLQPRQTAPPAGNQVLKHRSL